MLRILVPFMLLALPAAALAQETLPRFDVAKQCRDLANMSGGSEQVYGFCFDNEQAEYNALKAQWGSTPATAQQHCMDLARMSGGSYQVLRFCVNEEVAAGSENSEKEFKF